MIYNTSLLQYDDSLRNTILDYNVKLDPLKKEDSIFVWQSIGNYSLTGFEMTLRRNSLKYLVNYYLPSGLFVVVSWVRIYSIENILKTYFLQAGFLIPPEIVPGRMTLLVTIFLVLINIFNNVTSNSPNVEGLTAISSKIFTMIKMSKSYYFSLDHHVYLVRVWSSGRVCWTTPEEEQTHQE